MNYTEETINDIQKSVIKVLDRVIEINADNLSYVDIKYIREHLMTALYDTGSLVDDLMSETVKDKYGDYDEDQPDPYDSGDRIADGFYLECVKKYREHEIRVILYKNTGERYGYVRLKQPVLDCTKIRCSSCITFNAIVDDDDRFGGEHGHWIGFNCAHDSNDAKGVLKKYVKALTESIEHNKSCSIDMSAAMSIDKALAECCKVVDQLVDEIYYK